MVGGCGHVGLSLAISLANRAMSVAAFDINKTAVTSVGIGQLPFHEPGAELGLREALYSGRLVVTMDPAYIRNAEHVIVAIDGNVEDTFAAVGRYLASRQLLVLCNTLQPGDTARLEKLVADIGIDVDIAYCPERIAEGKAMTELGELPQIVASRTEQGLDRAARLFRRLTSGIVHMPPEEAELAKLFSNAWRYISFAAANEMYAIANDRGLDYERIRRGLIRDYPRAAGLPPAGLTAGPCLRRNVVALIQSSGAFAIGRAAVAANEGLADYVAGRLVQRYDLAHMRVGILGMAYKSGSDDIRGSLAYRLKHVLTGRTREVLCTDPLVTSDPDLLPLSQVLDLADLLIVAVPHPEYEALHTVKPIADIWGVTGHGVQV